MRKLVFFPILAVIGLGVSLSFAQLPAQAVVSFTQLKISDEWVKDREVSGWIAGPGHYFFADSSDIDLNIVPMEEDLRKALDESSTEAFIEQLMTGKNKINGLFGVGLSELRDFNVEKSTDFASVTLFTEQVIGDESNLILEKYFMKAGRAVHVELRWKSYVAPEILEKARVAFGELEIKFKRGE